MQKITTLVQHMYNKIHLFLLPCLIFSMHLHSQEKLLLKTNLLGWGTGTFNLGAELPMTSHLTVGLSGSYNPWVLQRNSKLQHLLVRPEVRFYPCCSLKKYFIGIQGVYGVFNAGGLNIPIFPLIKNKRYIGTMGGVSGLGGYQFPVNRHWSIEMLLGAGYIRTYGKLYQCPRCGRFLEKKKKNYLGATDMAVSLIYVIN